MFDWNPTRTLDSAIVPGVRYHFKTFSAQRKSDLLLELADSRDAARELSIEYQDEVEEVEYDEVKAGDQLVRRTPKPGFEAAERRNIARFSILNAELGVIAQRFERPATLRVYLDRIEGLSIKGAPVTIETFISDAPEELAEEAFAFIQKHGTIDLGNLPSPGTSADPVAGATNDTNAGSALTQVTVQRAPAESILA